MPLLGKDEILSADDLGATEVDVPEWGGTVRVRGLTGAERDRMEFQISLARQQGSTDLDMRASCVGRCLVDDKGDRLFADHELRALGRKSGAALDRLFDIVRNLSGMTDENLRRDAENFAGAPNGDSPSA